MTRRVRVGDAEFVVGAAELQQVLAEAHAAHVRPLCLCRPAGIPMVVARIHGRCVLKRMPGAGPRHDPNCNSYEPPYELTGFGYVVGNAINENAESGITELRLGFALSKRVVRSAPRSSDGPSAAEGIGAGADRTEGSKLSLRALLHYLWQEAEFNRWRPGMAGKRNWAVIRKFLLAAAEGKTAKGRPLRDSLYIPEVFSAEREWEISARRLAFMNRARAAEGKLRPLLLLVGEAKDIAPARFGHRLTVKHLPKFPFLLSEDVQRGIELKFASELSLWNATPGAHLIAIASFWLDPGGVAVIEAAALMNVTGYWIPFEDSYDAALIDALTARGASFLKALRYDLPRDRPLASVILSKDGADPVAMAIAPPGAGEAYCALLDGLTPDSGMAAWVWRASEEEMPPLPL